MAFPTTPEETLKYYLFKVMSEEDASRFMSLKEVLAACEVQEPKWQALYAVTVHLHVLGSFQAIAEFIDYVDKRMVELESSIEMNRKLASILPASLGDAVAKIPHTQEELDLASIYLAWTELIQKGMAIRDKERLLQFLILLARAIKPLMDKVFKDKLPYMPWWFRYWLLNEHSSAFDRALCLVRNGTDDSDSEELSQIQSQTLQLTIDSYKETISAEIDAERYPFVGYAKLMAANTLIPMLLKQGDYEAAVGAMTKVAECLPTKEVFLKLEELVDKWMNLCENIPLEQPAATKQTGALANGEYQWVSLVDSVAAITGLAGDMTNESIDRCFEAESLAVADKHSGDFWAWKYGYIVGRLALALRPVLQRGEMPLRNYGLGDRDDWPNGLVVYSLLSGCDPAANYFPMWLPADGHQYLTEVAPTNGLYWAMRVGFADAMRDKPVAILPQTSPIQKIEKIENIVTSTALRQIKDDEEIKRLLQAVAGRLPPSAEEIETYLLETLNDTFDRLPLQVRDHLKQAELDFKSGTRQSNARVEFVKSVEAALDCLFISLVRSYYKQYKLGWPFIVPSPDGSKNEYGIRKWGEYFCKLAQPVSQQLGNVNQPGINRFLKEYYPHLNYCELEVLGKSLQDVQKLRGSSAHYQSQFPLNKEIQQLKELRKMVLGLEGCPSVIKQMVELFGNKRDTA